MIYITIWGGGERKKKKRRRKNPWLGWLKLEASKALCVKKNPNLNFKKMEEPK
jgi:hypothetical protein